MVSVPILTERRSRYFSCRSHLPELLHSPLFPAEFRLKKDPGEEFFLKELLIRDVPARVLPAGEGEGGALASLCLSPFALFSFSALSCCLSVLLSVFVFMSFSVS